ncbi:TPA: LuxR C-terminal-related transcriptional regulator [Vibrio cholerae]|uniref:LuxR C-terminal-related transcriptional regulator n=1 Tax=Vibrio cholerae TaxID=666 RepID=UPI000E4ACEAF|nr:LuxR C-terminal-related transcriptional regulator [Vibrio cholerae]RGP86568.1 hypothetical protein BC354_13295 [Vibrio cholerae]RGP94332.1 hypothetical protein BC352_12950 [Vibrio cholerae]TQP68468.1 hypothetical protein FLL76_00555 [Vibrio cholerae]
MNEIICNESHLDTTDQQLLLAHASGMSSRDIAKQLGTDTHTVQLLERELQKKLQARSMAHAIAQAFIGGILTLRKATHLIEGEIILKTLCLVIVTGCLMDAHGEANRTRSPMRNNRNPTTVMRVMRAGRNLELDA